MNGFAELAINIEAPLDSTFHYHVPFDLRRRLQVGHLVEVEFGRRMAQGVVVALASEAPVEETKPIISIIDPRPVVAPWQLELAHWLSENYLTPLNACIRLLLPPGVTRWADITVDLAPGWNGEGIRTEAQQAVVDLIRQRGFLRGRQLKRALKGVRWQDAVNQLARRNILMRGSVLDPPRLRPKRIRTAELIASPKQIWQAASQLGRQNKKSEVLAHLLKTDDPLPPLDQILLETGAKPSHVKGLEQEGAVQRSPERQILVPHERKPAEWPENLRRFFHQMPTAAEALPAEIVEEILSLGLVGTEKQPEAIGLAISEKEAATCIFRLRGATTYQQILQLLADEAQAVSLSQIYEKTAATLYHLRRLAKAELIRLSSYEVWRDPLADRDFVPASPPQLTSDQARSWGRIKMAMHELVDSDSSSDTEEELDEPEIESEAADSATVQPFLLHGVTGSGKTEIYMRAIDMALEHGKRAIVLVPEIALTPQTVRRFAARFPGQVALLHSRLSDGERYDTWRRARQGLIDILIGPRSALFAPLADVGVIVLDEEHDNSYKQTPPVPPPYYHARETAIAMGEIVGAVVILGSATPDIVSYHRAQAGSYQLLELPKRVMGHRRRVAQQAARLEVSSVYRQSEDSEDAVTIPLPPVKILDMRQELRRGNRSIFSRLLHTEMDQVLARREQAILFLNRRGTSSFVLCRDCGELLRCPRCELPLTYHRPHLALMCHHCGRQEPEPEQCPACGSRRIRYFGLGTEGLEAEVKKEWPEARVVRWDRDTTAGKDKHDAILSSFIEHDADILIGTQMIAKGLDLPLVTLVGVMSADVSLGLPDYRTGERTFQILAQVAGRAGRGLLGGRVLIQTYQPGHYAIQSAAEHDFVSFYLEEIRFRTQYGLPPFRHMVKLLVADPVRRRAEDQAKDLANSLRQHVRANALVASEVIGPAPPFFQRIDGRYRWQIIVRTPDPRRLLEEFHIPQPWVVEIDPVSTL